MEIAIEEDGIDEEPREEKLLLTIRLDSILYTGPQRSEQRGLSRGSNLFSSKFLYPATHSLSRLFSEIQNDAGILIDIEDGKVFLGIDDDGILPESLLLFQGLDRLGGELLLMGRLQI